MKTLMGYIAGLLFGLGLAIGGMTDPARVLDFLDILGDWDPTLMFVLGGAVVTTFIGYRLVLRRSQPLFAPAFQVPTRRDLDGKLIGGAALFGVGWGLSGYCPGPAFASFAGLSATLMAMLVAMVAGWWLARVVSRGEGKMLTDFSNSSTQRDSPIHPDREHNMHSTSRFMTAALVAMLGSFLVGTSAMAAEVSFKTPVIDGVGQIRSQPAQDLTYQPDVDKDYKAVFNLTRAGSEPDQISHGLQHVARAVNLYAEANVPLERLDFVVVISGKATPVVLDNEHYRAKFGVDNPNLPVIEQLSKVGVDVVVCSQALAMLGYPDSGVDKHVRLALSALTAVIELQQEGYALVPL